MLFERISAISIQTRHFHCTFDVFLYIRVEVLHVFMLCFYFFIILKHSLSATWSNCLERRSSKNSPLLVPGIHWNASKTTVNAKPARTQKSKYIYVRIIWTCADVLFLRFMFQTQIYCGWNRMEDRKYTLITRLIFARQASSRRWSMPSAELRRYFA